MRDWVVFSIYAFALLALIGFSSWLWLHNWNECREHFSFLYCLTKK